MATDPDGGARGAPGPLQRLFEWLSAAVFSRVAVDPGWVRDVRACSERGAVVYVMRSRSYLDFFALRYFVGRAGLPALTFVMHLGLWLLEPLARGGLWRALFGPREPERDALERAVREGASALLFLRAPATVVTPSRRGANVSTDQVRWLIEQQRRSERKILLVPQVIVWGRSPDTLGQGVVDQLFGPREYPGRLRVFAQFVWYLRQAILRASEPLDLKAMLEQNPELDDDALVNRVHWTLVSRLDRERRVILGPRFKSADRIQDEVIRHPTVRAALDEAARREGKPREAVERGARRDLARLGARPTPWLLPWAEILLDRIFHRLYDGIEVDHDGLARLREHVRKGPVVLLPSHKSHLDYLLVSFVCWRAGMSIPLIAAGDNLAFWPAGPVLRRFGAFFIRRRFGGARLYTTLVDTYLRKVLAQGAPVEFFLEGGRSRTGKLLPPRLGLLGMVTSAARAVGADVAYVPISIGYERIVEQRSYERELAGREKRAENAGQLVESLPRVLSSRYGRAYIQFGEVQRDEPEPEVADPRHADSEGEVIGSERSSRGKTSVQSLADRVMFEIDRITPVTPAALIATALLARRRGGTPRAELLERIDALVDDLRAAGARFGTVLAVRYEGGLRSYRVDAIDEVLALLIDSRDVTVHGAAEDAIYQVPEDRRIALDYYKNNLMHFFVGRAMLSLALLSTGRAAEGVDRVEVRALFDALRALLAREFRFDRDRDRAFDDALALLFARADVAVEGGRVRIAPEPRALVRVRMHAELLRNFIESALLASRSLALLEKGPLPARELSSRALALGRRWLLTGELTRPEAVTRPAIEGMFAQLRDAGVLVGGDAGPQRLADAYDRAALDALVAGVARFL
jgi:glycerol-3-phosphate O-acyltransferase